MKNIWSDLFSTDSSEYRYSCSILTSLRCCMISLCCQLRSISYIHMCLKITHNSKLITKSLPCCRLHMYYGLLPHSLPHYIFFSFYSSYRAGICVVLCKSTVSGHLYDKSEYVSLHSLHWGQHLSIHQLPLYSFLHYSTKQIE